MLAGYMSSSSLALPRTRSLFAAKACLPMLQTRCLKSSDPCPHTMVIVAQHVIILAGSIHCLKHICRPWLHLLSIQFPGSCICGGYYYTWFAFLHSLFFPLQTSRKLLLSTQQTQGLSFPADKSMVSQHVLWPLCPSKLLSPMEYVQSNHIGIEILESTKILVCSTKSASSICRSISSCSAQNILSAWMNFPLDLWKQFDMPLSHIYVAWKDRA